jgi:hypothetical protein
MIDERLGKREKGVKSALDALRFAGPVQPFIFQRVGSEIARKKQTHGPRFVKYRPFRER